jgi:hypothetical protein
MAKPKKRSPLLTIGLGALVLLCLCGLVAQLANPGSTTPTPAPAQLAAATAAPAATDAPVATEAPAATAGPTSAPATPAPAATPVGTISKDTVSFPWPFSIDAGRVACINGTHIVFFGNDGETYAINGTARGAARNGSERYKDLDEIWLDNPSIEGAKIPVIDVISIGLELCR